jgi:glycosyltransferase involved in cell wall biosynthesis
MPNKINILLLPLWTLNEWGQGRTFQKVAEQLAERPDVKRVVCLFPPVQPNKRYQLPIQMRWISKKLILMRNYSRAVPMDYPPYRLRKWLNDHIGQLVRYSLALLGLRSSNTVIWIFPPLENTHINAYLGKSLAHLVVTQVVDNFMALEEGEQESLKKLAITQYPVLAAQSDLVITGSLVMHDYFSAFNKHTYLMENAVDSRFIAEASDLPCRLNGTPPRLGYIGFISSRTDIDLLECIARFRPDWKLIIAGPIHAISPDAITGLVNLTNVDYLGEIPYEALPALIKSFDICLIPHKVTSLSKSMSPLKFFQYLASGRPIVSTPIAGIERFSEYCLIGKTCSEFISQIEVAIQSYTLDDGVRRIRAARSETWESRVSEIFQKVKRLYCITDYPQNNSPTQTS